MKQLLKKSSSQGSRSGFTLIEVVLVLAIAGLIFVIVFLAVGAAQRARRDSARKDLAGKYTAAVEQYSSNNNGTLPGDGWTGAGYFNNSGNDVDPGAGANTYQAVAPTAAGQLQFDAGATCAGAGTARQYVVRVFQEQGGAYCIDNR